MAKNKRPTPDLEDLIYRFIRSSGWLIPTTIEEVEAQEKLGIGQGVTLPEGLRDPLAALDPTRRRSSHRPEPGASAHRPASARASERAPFAPEMPERNDVKEAPETYEAYDSGGAISSDLARGMKRARKAAPRAPRGTRRAQRR